MRLCVYFIFLSIFSLPLKAQETSTDIRPKSNTSMLENQFEYVIQKSTNYKEFKVVKKEQLYLLKKNSMDSILRLKTELNELKSKFSTQNAAVKDLNDSIQVVQGELIKSKSAQNKINLFGASVSKTVYNLILWGLVVVLFLLLIVSGFQLKSAKSKSKAACKEQTKIEEEFEVYKRKALEKEQKLGRQLQDEINKQKKTKK